MTRLSFATNFIFKDVLLDACYEVLSLVKVSLHFFFFERLRRSIAFSDVKRKLNPYRVFGVVGQSPTVLKENLYLCGTFLFKKRVVLKTSFKMSIY